MKNNRRVGYIKGGGSLYNYTTGNMRRNYRPHASTSTPHRMPVVIEHPSEELAVVGDAGIELRGYSSEESTSPTLCHSALPRPHEEDPANNWLE